MGKKGRIQHPKPSPSLQFPSFLFYFPSFCFFFLFYLYSFCLFSPYRFLSFLYRFIYLKRPKRRKTANSAPYLSSPYLRIFLSNSILSGESILPATLHRAIAKFSPFQGAATLANCNTKIPFNLFLLSILTLFPATLS